ncbi:hypothetical protein M1116_03905 [Patescibacteria group bacterium]|nr:hypothetical protein [Patescibacteria group bacterium]
MNINTIKENIGFLSIQCTNNTIICGFLLIFTVLASLSLFIFTVFAVKFLFKKIGTLKNYVVRYMNSYGDDKLWLATLKRIGGWNFGKVLYFEYLQQKLIFPIKQIYYPSAVSLISTILVAVTIFFFPFGNIDGKEYSTYIESNYYQNFFTIHAGIGAIILAFLILVAESSDLGKNYNKARLILKETLLFPLSVFEISSLFLLIISHNTYAGYLSILIVGLLTIWAICSVIRLFINRYIFLEKEKDLVNDMFSKRLDQAVKERIATNTLLEYFEKSKYAIDYSYFRPSNENYKALSTTKRGLLSDVHLKKLERILSDIEREANLLHLSIRKESKKEKKADKLSKLVNIQDNTSLSSVELSVLKLVGGKVTDDSSEIISIPKKLYENVKLRKRIQESLGSIFKITSEDSTEKEIRLELDETKDKAFSAIRESKVGVLGSVMEVYVGLIGQFLNTFQAYGGGYTSEAARKERNSLFGGWPYVRWIREDLHDIITEAIRSENDKLVREVAHIPSKIMYLAYTKKDHLIFQEFASFQSILYWETKNVKNKVLRKFLIDRTSRYLKEFVDYPLVRDIENTDISLGDIAQIKDFVFEILQNYKNLFKIAFDRKHIYTFEKFLISSQEIFKRFEPSKGYRQTDIELRLKVQGISDQQKQELSLELDKLKLLTEVEEAVKQKKRELIFGMSAWCLHKIEKTGFKEDELLKVWQMLFKYLPKDFDSAFKTYLSSSSRDTQSFWGWDWWELEEKRGKSDGVLSTTIDIDGKLNTLFAILILKIANGKTVDQFNVSGLIIPRDISFYFDGENSAVISIINKIMSNQAEWKNIVSAEEINANITVKQILAILVQRWKDEEKNRLIMARVDQGKVQEFINNFVDAYDSEICLRRLLLINGSMSKTLSFTKSKRYWGFNEIQDKEPFLTFGDVDYGDWGEHYGRGLAESEDSIIFKKIRSGSTRGNKSNSITEAVNQAINTLNSNGYKPKIMFTTFHLGEWRRATFNETEFVPVWKVTNNEYSKIPNFMGIYKLRRRQIPIFRIWLNEGKKEVPEVIVTDLKKHILLDQHYPYSNKTEQLDMFQKDNLAFKVIDLSDDLNKTYRKKLIKDNPNWLSSQTDKESYLKQKVVVHIKEKFKLTILDRKASIRVSIPHND